MKTREENRGTMRSRMQHYILNWIVISRYQMVHHGLSKKATQRCLVKLESILRRINLINS